MTEKHTNMDAIEKTAWEMLTGPEKNSLMLTLSEGMSSWEAGEILGISHYKYLEIKERAETFFKMFVEYFKSTGTLSLFSPQSVTDERFRDYIEASIEKRLPKKEAVLYPGDSSLIVTSIRNTHIINAINNMSTSNVAHDKLTLRLIMEFDRWNNWRILPRKIQMPSAYKRRNNKRDKVYLRYITSIKAKKINALMDVLWYVPKKEFKSRYYICLISDEVFDDGYMVISIKADSITLEKVNKLLIYAFKTEEHADLFGFHASRYKEKTTKSTAGQQFWPQYREIISRAVNFNQVNNINFYVENLDTAYNVSRRPKEVKKNGAKRLNPKKI